MHIAIDGWPLKEKMSGGTSVFTLNLIKSLSMIDSVNKYTIYQPAGAADELDIPANNFTVKTSSNGLISHYTSVYFGLQQEKPDVFLTGLFPFTPQATKLVLVVYTLSHILYKHYLPVSSRLIWPVITSLSLRKASHVVVLSEATKKELEQLYKAKTQANVVYLGCDKNVFRPVEHSTGSLKTMKDKYRINGPYILYAGILEPRKDLPTLVRAVAKLRREKAIEHCLVLAGRKGWLCTDIFNAIQESNMKDHVRVTGYLPYSDYPLILAGADVFVYPSHHEGFGLPVLEAMACGTPVITTKASCFPEVVGDAGLMVEPGNVSDLANAIYDVVSNPGVRQQMIESGLNRAKQFTWERTAGQILQIFGTVAGRN